jgi:hypothetical protein
LEEETPIDSDPVLMEQFLLKKYPWENFVKELVLWIYSKATDITTYLSEHPSHDDYRGEKVTPIQPHLQGTQQQVLISWTRLI